MTVKRKVFDVVGKNGLFSLVTQSKKLSGQDLIDEADIPVYSSQDGNNGIMGFTNHEPDFIVESGCPTLVFGDHTRTMNIAENDFSAADNVKILCPHKMGVNELLFVATAWKKRIPDMGYSRHWRKAKLVGIELPVNVKNEPDYSYMSEFVKEKREKALLRYKNFAEKQLSKIEYKSTAPLQEIEWKAFSILDLFESFIAGKGGGLNHLNKANKGGINYIGATNRNNGVLCYVEDNETSKKKILPGNCIGFIKNGDGSAGYAIYKAESFISTNDVIYGYADWLNKYTGLFFVAAQDMIENKYSHGYKRNMEHLKGDKIMLPVNDRNEPDWAYMEQYAKNMMYRKYQQYLAYLDKKQHGQC